MHYVYARLLERSNDPCLLDNVWYGRNTVHRTLRKVQATWANGEHFHTWKDLNTARACLSVRKDTLARAIKLQRAMKKYPELRFSYVEPDGVVGGRPVVGYYKGDLVYEWSSVDAASEELGYSSEYLNRICRGRDRQFTQDSRLPGMEIFFVDNDPYAR